jgi:hypothetical protein
VTYQVNAIGVKGFKLTEVLLDNQANISIMRPELLRAFERSDSEININGVGGVQLHTSETGYLDDFFRVYTSPDMMANVLSFSDVEGVYPITYQPKVQLPDRDIVFRCRNKLYVANFGTQVVAVTKAYTKAEEVRAHEAYEIMARKGVYCRFLFCRTYICTKVFVLPNGNKSGVSGTIVGKIHWFC